MIAFRTALPDVAALLDNLSRDIARSRITTQEDFDAACRRSWTPARMADVDDLIPRWSEMASYADGKTLCHVTAALLALYRLDEYRAAGGHLRTLMEWTVVLHDIAKQPAHGRRDHRHAFRSAVVALETLPRLGFEPKAAFAAKAESWRAMVLQAHLRDPASGEVVQDNAFLPPLVAGAHEMLESDGARIVTAIALHLAITVVGDWPSLAPLDAEQEQALVTPEIAELLQPLMLADNGGWNLLDPATLRSMYAETRAVFARIASGRRP